MDFANRGNRPTQTQPSANTENEQQSQSFKPVSNASGSSNDKAPAGNRFSKITSVAMLFAGTLLILAVVLALVFGGNGKNGSAESALIKTDQYQAVFIDSQDGQVYFGKLSVYNESLYQLRDIFYVRVENPIQPEGANQAAQPNISLAKLGKELHGPEDTMFVARDKVLYWENLTDDGQVVTAITNYYANGGAEGAANNDQQATQPTGTEQQDDTPADTDTTTP